MSKNTTVAVFRVNESGDYRSDTYRSSSRWFEAGGCLNTAAKSKDLDKQFNKWPHRVVLLSSWLSSFD
jgi:hypothetical protein